LCPHQIFFLEEKPQTIQRQIQLNAERCSARELLVVTLNTQRQQPKENKTDGYFSRERTMTKRQLQERAYLSDLLAIHFRLIPNEPRE
jgi:hypothetical protein